MPPLGSLKGLRGGVIVVSFTLDELTEGTLVVHDLWVVRNTASPRLADVAQW